MRPQLLDTNAVGVKREKMYKLDDHVACAVAGLTGIHMRKLLSAVLSNPFSFLVFPAQQCYTRLGQPLTFNTLFSGD